MRFDSDKHRKWILGTVGETSLGNRLSSQVSHKYLKTAKQNHTLLKGEIICHHLNQVIILFLINVGIILQ